MRWNLRMKAAERGIWKSTELRRLLADAGLESSAGKMSCWLTGTPNTIRLDELDVICAVLGCTPADVLIAEPETVQLQRPVQQAVNDAGGSGTGRSSRVAPRRGKGRTTPPV